MVFVYITCASSEEAKKLAKILLEKKSAGCVNIFPIQSMYPENGSLKEVNEYAIIVKTIDSRVQAVEDIVRANHSYRSPFIGTLSLSRLNREYKEWLTAVLA
ncbi:MAG: CutA1 divalent ion tolerance protein, periplasmic divalent cation tolerance protein [Candidatus Peregrinibacteria bacterium GW2011_GWC2_39_14]|nr:MAG: CutA1 divalent ion tolerance protein, periplasmic divalent cation tolerance protein [Candidatus Peregrinibacteria bacterium GW2011_GWC2_39_14]